MHPSTDPSPNIDARSADARCADGMEVTQRACYVCGTRGNPVVAVERPVEARFGIPLLPEGEYRFARCRACGTLYVDSDVTDEYLAAVYEPESTGTAMELLDVDHGVILGRRLPEFRAHWRAMVAERPAQAGEQLMDLGCQTGDFGAVAQGESGVVPNGIELSESYAEMCRRRWGPASRVHLGPAATAPFAPGEFQYESAFETLEHMCDPIETLERMRGWLSDDGVLAVSVPSSDYFHLKYWLLRRSPLAGPLGRAFTRRLAFYARQVLPHTHVYNFTPRSLRQLLERAGFRPVRVGLTGWHGRLAHTAGPLARLAGALTGGRVAVAPSVFALARKAA